MNEIPDDLREHLEASFKTKEFRLVGSRALDNLFQGVKCSSQYSDYDIIVDHFYGVQLKDKMKAKNEHSVSESNYHSGYKFGFGNRQINVIPLPPVDYAAWIYGTKGLQAFGKESEANAILLTDKDSRIAMLEQLVAFYKMSHAMSRRFKSVELPYGAGAYATINGVTTEGSVGRHIPAKIQFRKTGSGYGQEIEVELENVWPKKSRVDKLDAI